DANGCTDCDSITVAEDPAGINTINNTLSITISPNPARNELTIQLNTQAVNAYQIQISDANGKTMLNRTLQSTGDPKQTVHIPLTTFSPGAYSISINQNASCIIKKFIVTQ
ncbi:MAG TPA: T9SS type A sorting domain-containing protein, partial [Bacteroidia bacterium]|nr:T9SS type A sorting domain-containing protein [Bacteroidia bacterium]